MNLTIAVDWYYIVIAAALLSPIVVKKMIEAYKLLRK